MLTTAKVLKRFEEEVESRPSNEVTHADRALCALFKSDVVSHALNKYIKENEDHFNHDNTIYSFHKSFREWNVIEDKNLATTVWCLIHESNLFIETINLLNKELNGNAFIHIDITDEKQISTDNLNNNQYC